MLIKVHSMISEQTKFKEYNQRNLFKLILEESESESYLQTIQNRLLL